jgi:cyclopropane fatty-acyl-phospholipid synthase-like methyltransferase
VSASEQPRHIDSKRTIDPVEGALVSPDDYAGVLLADFDASYAEGRDVWSDEAAMRHAPLLLHAALGRAGNVLDVGAGRGHDTVLLLERGHSVTAVDLVAAPEWPALQAQWGERVRFLAHGVSELEGTARFDAVLDNGCLHHQHPSYYRTYLTHLRTLLQPQGLLTLSVFHTDESQGRLFRNKAQRLYREFTEAELAELLHDCGFSVVESQSVARPMPGLRYLVVTARKVRN